MLELTFGIGEPCIDIKKSLFFKNITLWKLSFKERYKNVYLCTQRYVNMICLCWIDKITYS